MYSNTKQKVKIVVELRVIASGREIYQYFERVLHEDLEGKFVTVNKKRCPVSYKILNEDNMYRATFPM